MFEVDQLMQVLSTNALYSNHTVIFKKCLMIIFVGVNSFGKKCLHINLFFRVDYVEHFRGAYK